MKIIAAAFALLAAQVALAAEDLPNVVIILADDLGWNDVGYHGSEIATREVLREEFGRGHSEMSGAGARRSVSAAGGTIPRLAGGGK